MCARLGRLLRLINVFTLRTNVMGVLSLNTIKTMLEVRIRNWSAIFLKIRGFDRFPIENVQ